MEGFFAALILIFIGLTIIRKATKPTRKRRYRYKPIYDYRSPEEKGAEGEAFVSNIIGGTVFGEQYLINDIIITYNGKSSQIDHILINTNGIYVIETKNYAGYIYGSEEDMYWTQVINQYTKNRFYNPVKQNATHVYNLKRLLNTTVPIHSLVVFTKANIQKVYIPNVITIRDLAIEVHNKKGPLTAQEMGTLYNKIMELKFSNTTTKQEHVENIQKRYK